MSDTDAKQDGSESDVSCQPDSFEERAEGSSPGLIVEFWDFIVHNKKWWIAPIVIVLMLVGLLIFLAETPVGPLIYPGV